MLPIAIVFKGIHLFFIIFLVLLFVSFLGYYSPKKFLPIIFTIVFVIPTSTSFSFLNSFQGIYFYDSITIGLILGYLSSRNKKEFLNALNKQLSFVLLISIYILYFLFAIFNGSELKYLLKDLRPLIFMVQVFVFYRLLFANIKRIDFQFIQITICFLSVFTMLKLVIAQRFVGLTGDDFHIDNLYRYLDAGTYYSACFIISVFTDNKRRDTKDVMFFVSIAAAIVILIISNSRFIFVALLLTIALFNVKNLQKFIKQLAFSILALSAFMYYSISVGASRVVNAFQKEELTYQLFNRFSPAIEKIEQFDILSLIFGDGIGEPFFIPWFHYRDLTPYNINIDSAYLTFFAKFGFFSIFILYSFSYFYKFVGIKKSNPLSLFLLIMFIVSATPYHAYAIGLIFGYFMILRYQNEIDRVY